jgi:hypothetical protein
VHPIDDLWKEYQSLPEAEFRDSGLIKVPVILGGTAAFPVSCVACFDQQVRRTCRHFPNAA